MNEAQLSVQTGTSITPQICIDRNDVCRPSIGQTILAFEIPHIETPEAAMKQLHDCAANFESPRLSGKYEVFNFEVEHHHTYVASGVRVHNDSRLHELALSEYVVNGNLDIDGNGITDAPRVVADPGGLTLPNGHHVPYGTRI